MLFGRTIELCLDSYQNCVLMCWMIQRNVARQKNNPVFICECRHIHFPPVCHPLSPAYLMQLFLSWCWRFTTLGLVHFSHCTVLVSLPCLSTRILQIPFIFQILFNVVRIFRLSVMLDGKKKLAHYVRLLHSLKDCWKEQTLLSHTVLSLAFNFLTFTKLVPR